MGRTNRLVSIRILLALVGFAALAQPAASAEDWITALPRESIHIDLWPGGKKVAVCFVLYVEVWGYGQGPKFRSDMADRDPDIVDESFRQYAIDCGISRVGRLFKGEQLPLSIALNARFPGQYKEVWQALRSLVPNAPGHRSRHEQLDRAAALGAWDRSTGSIHPPDARSH